MKQYGATPMTTLLMCKPTHYDVMYKINPWMDVKIKADKSTALVQWQQLHDTIINCGANVALIEQVEGYPDMVFTANAALVTGNKTYLSHFKHTERQGERPYFKEWFVKHDFEICGDELEDYVEDEYHGPYFEGAGDALFVGDVLYAGFGHRSDKKVYKKFKAIGIENVIDCELIDDHFYHLDTCFCPLTNDLAIWYPQAFSFDSHHLMQQTKELIEISHNDAMKFAANAVVIGKHVIMPNGCDETADKLKERGFVTHFVPMSEFLKAGGACKCLTLTIQEV